jgi:hypothetical protein
MRVIFVVAVLIAVFLVVVLPFVITKERKPAGPVETEVSKDALYIAAAQAAAAGRIVKNMWVIFVLLPLVAVLLMKLLA